LQGSLMGIVASSGISDVDTAVRFDSLSVSTT